MDQFIGWIVLLLEAVICYVLPIGIGVILILLTVLFALWLLD